MYSQMLGVNRSDSSEKALYHAILPPSLRMITPSYNALSLREKMPPIPMAKSVGWEEIMELSVKNRENKYNSDLNPFSQKSFITGFIFFS